MSHYDIAGLCNSLKLLDIYCLGLYTELYYYWIEDGEQWKS